MIWVEDGLEELELRTWDNSKGVRYSSLLLASWTIPTSRKPSTAAQLTPDRGIAAVMREIARSGQTVRSIASTASLMNQNGSTNYTA